MKRQAAAGSFFYVKKKKREIERDMDRAAPLTATRNQVGITQGVTQSLEEQVKMEYVSQLSFMLK